jgi:hypothetical protein
MVESLMEGKNRCHRALARLARTVEQDAIGEGAQQQLLPPVRMDAQLFGERHPIESELYIVPKLYH